MKIFQKYKEMNGFHWDHLFNNMYLIMLSKHNTYN